MTSTADYLCHPLRPMYPLWDGDPWTLRPTTPLTDAEVEVLRTCDGTPAEVNRIADQRITSVAGVFFLRHCPSGDVAFAMMRSTAMECSSTAVLFATGEAVQIQECNTRVGRR